MAVPYPMNVEIGSLAWYLMVLVAGLATGILVAWIRRVINRK